MSRTVKKSDPRFCKLDRDEARRLRDAIKTMYLQGGGTLELGDASDGTYRELAGAIDEYVAAQGWSVEYNDGKKDVQQKHVKIAPTFLKHLFYTKVNDELIQAHQYNIDIGYLYGFGKTLAEYKKALREPSRMVVDGTRSDHLRIVVTTVSGYGIELEKVRSRVEMLLQGAAVQTDYRDIPDLSGGRLIELYRAHEEKAIIMLMVGKEYLLDERCAAELCDLLESAREMVLARTVIIRLDDLCRGEYSLGLSTGRLRVVKFWIDQLEEHKALVTMVQGAAAVGNGLPGDVQDSRIAGIVGRVQALVTFLSEHARSTPYDHFINHYGMAELQKLLEVRHEHK